MKPGSNINDLFSLIGVHAKDQLVVATAWAVVKEIDWDDKTMTAVGLADDLEYYEVSLGIGSVYKRPAAGSKCLLGIIENQSAAAFLVDAEEVEEVTIRVDEMLIIASDSQLKITPSGFLIRHGNESLKKILSDLIDEILRIYAPMNKPGITAIKQRLNGLLTD